MPDQPCCDDGPDGHTEQQHHDASACFDQACPFDHPHGGPFPHPCDEGRVLSTWQYGVMYNDGSVARSWNGNTQEKRAREEVARYYADYPGTDDNVKVVRRLIGPWEEA